MQTTLDVARAISHPNSTCYALGFLGVAQSVFRDMTGLDDCDRALTAVSEEFVIPFWTLYAK